MRIVLFLAVSLLIRSAAGHAADDFLLDSISLSDPEIPAVPTVVLYDERCLPLWRQALSRPEVDLQRRVAATITQAFLEGMPDVNTLIPDLRTRLDAEGTVPSIRFAAARALIQMNDQESAARLFEQSQRGSQALRQLVEPVLAEWKLEAVRPVWMKRLQDPETRRQDLILAIRGLARVPEPQAVPRLLEFVHSTEQPVDLRLAAADAAGQITTSRFEADAGRLIKQSGKSPRLCAISLLSQHASAETVELLAGLMNETEPTIASKALARLRAIAPERALTFAEAAMRHADANVRREGIELYLGWPTPERIDFVGRLLDDHHPALRGRIREAFVTLAKQPELAAAVINVSRTVLADANWRGQEQATIVLAVLDNKPSAARMVELLKSPRDEVLITAAWGLRKLAVPETAAGILAQLTVQTDRRKQDPPPSLDVQVAHLCEAMGVLKYAPADPLLQEYIPLDMGMGYLSRPSAIWALGKIHEGQTNEALAAKLIARVVDPATMPPETSEVRQMSAVSLVRIQARSTVDQIRKQMGPTPSPHREGLTFRWAIMQLTGETIPLPESPRVVKGGWFLEPISARTATP